MRRYERGFFHGKAFLFAGEEGVISGSSNFTAAGLTRNLELNIGHYQPALVRQVKDWFDTVGFLFRAICCREGWPIPGSG